MSKAFDEKMQKGLICSVLDSMSIKFEDSIIQIISQSTLQKIIRVC